MRMKTKALPRILSLALAAAMMLTMTVSAFASVQPYNLDATKVSGKFLATTGAYTATVTGPSGYNNQNKIGNDLV